MTFTARRWGWFALCVDPAHLRARPRAAYAWIRRQEIERAVLGDGPAPGARQRRGGRSTARSSGGASPRCGTVLDRPEGPPAPGDAIKKTLRHIIVFAIIVVALYLLLPRLVDTQQTVQLLSGASYVLLGLAVALEVAALLGYANLSATSSRCSTSACACVEVLGDHPQRPGREPRALGRRRGRLGGHVQRPAQARGAARPHLRGHRRAAVLQLRRAVVLLRARHGVSGRLRAASPSSATWSASSSSGCCCGSPSTASTCTTTAPRCAGGSASSPTSSTGSCAARSCRSATSTAGSTTCFAGMRRMTAPPRRLSHHHWCCACGFWFFDMLCLWATFLAFDYTIGLGSLLVGYVVAYSIGTLAPTPGRAGRHRGHPDRPLRELRRALGDRRRRGARLPPHQLLAADPARASSPTSWCGRARPTRSPRARSEAAAESEMAPTASAQRSRSARAR